MIVRQARRFDDSTHHTYVIRMGHVGKDARTDYSLFMIPCVFYFLLVKSWPGTREAWRGRTGACGFGRADGGRGRVCGRRGDGSCDGGGIDCVCRLFGTRFIGRYEGEPCGGAGANGTELGCGVRGHWQQRVCGRRASPGPRSHQVRTVEQRRAGVSDAVGTRRPSPRLCGLLSYPPGRSTCGRRTDGPRRDGRARPRHAADADGGTCFVARPSSVHLAAGTGRVFCNVSSVSVVRG